MSRARRRSKQDDRPDVEFFVILIAAPLFFLFGYILINVLKINVIWGMLLSCFLAWATASIIVLIGQSIFTDLFSSFKTISHLKIQENIKSLGLDDDVRKFILNEGHEKHLKNSWIEGDYCFTENKLTSFCRYLKKHSLEINVQKLKNILTEKIQDITDEVVEESLKIKPLDQPLRFADLSGPDFERLLVKLYEAVGYKVQHTGRAGDQGADLILIMDGKRYLVQAKNYTGTVSNDAVREAFSGLNIHHCTKAIVVTTGEFTKGALELAKSDNVQLVGKTELQKQLIKYLHEKWV